MIATSGGNKSETARERERESALQFYVGGCGKVPSCLMLTGHLSNWYDATALSLLCHIAWLQLPQYISWRKNCFKHFDSMSHMILEYINQSNLWIYKVLLRLISHDVTAGENSETKLNRKSQNGSYIY